ncbi:MAG: tRNA (guanosine(46)-N7)-methyltransferase TrmB [Cyclobacteriaceae bacterium]|nr:tRNA (guanosine(46)-N7)-methyltransferase TrmB [Cyclobacteriaceae bacterium]
MRKKLARFAENAQRSNVLEPGKPLYETIKGNWNKIQFKNDNPITLELACGRGEYTVGLAQHSSASNFIGIDLKGDRIWKGSGQAIELGLEHVAFLRTQIHDLLNFFEPNEVAEIWLTFPDPRPRDRDIRRRLTNPRFMEMYKTVLRPEGWFRFKTDNTGLFEYTLEVLAERDDILDLEFTKDLYTSPLKAEHFGIKTKYEKLFSDAGEKIKYLKLRFKK